MCPKGNIVAPFRGVVIIRSSGVSTGVYLARLKFRTCIVEDPQCVVREIPPALVGGELVIGVGFCREGKPIDVTGGESARHAIIQSQTSDGGVVGSQISTCGLTDRFHVLLMGFRRWDRAICRARVCFILRILLFVAVAQGSTSVLLTPVLPMNQSACDWVSSLSLSVSKDTARVPVAVTCTANI